MWCVIKRASKFDNAQKIKFKNIVKEADQVNMKKFDKLMEKDPFLLFTYDSSNNIIAVGALKIPIDAHKKNVFDETQSDLGPEDVKLDPNDFQYEMGWIVSKKEGLGTIVTAILSNYNPESPNQKPKVYTTVRENNEKMRFILKRFGYLQVGEPYKSELGDYKIVLYVKKNN